MVQRPTKVFFQQLYSLFAPCYLENSYSSFNIKSNATYWITPFTLPKLITCLLHQAVYSIHTFSITTYNGTLWLFTWKILSSEHQKASCFTSRACEHSNAGFPTCNNRLRVDVFLLAAEIPPGPQEDEGIHQVQKMWLQHQNSKPITEPWAACQPSGPVRAPGFS